MSAFRILFLCLLLALPLEASTTLSVTPLEDTFTSANNSTSNYGGAGALNVSGSSAVNGLGAAQGVFDSFITFNTSTLKAGFDSTYGAGNWTITDVQLTLTEQINPSQTLFNRGQGTFEIRWIAADSFTEGTGTPAAPSGTGLNYSTQSSLLNAGTDVSLGTSFANVDPSTHSGNVPETYDLPFANTSVYNDLASGGNVSFYLTATSSGIGDTFVSRTGPGNPGTAPTLTVTVASAPEPGRSVLFAGSLVLLAMKRRRLRKP
jgi:hypothetical protein